MKPLPLHFHYQVPMGLSQRKERVPSAEHKAFFFTLKERRVGVQRGGRMGREAREGGGVEETEVLGKGGCFSSAVADVK